MLNSLSLTKKEILKGVSEKENIDFVKSLMKKLSYDPVYTDQVLDLLNKNKIETRSFVSWLAKNFLKNNYLEVGVRRGWTLYAAAARSPKANIFGFDLWYKNYANSANPGPKFVLSEAKKIGATNNINLIDGNSHKTLPKFFKSNKSKLFDLILIDGDHSKQGAYKDVKDVINNIKKGGILILDDLNTLPHLNILWNELSKEINNYKFFSFLDNAPGVGVAIRQL